MEKRTFPLTGVVNKWGEHLLFKDDEVTIVRYTKTHYVMKDVPLILPPNHFLLMKIYKDRQFNEYAVINEDDDNPEYIEWKKILDGFKIEKHFVYYPEKNRSEFIGETWRVEESLPTDLNIERVMN